jgi:hypothetical protein
MDADRDESVAVLSFELSYNFVRSGAVAATLSGELLKENSAFGHHLLNDDEALVGFNLVA